MDAWATVATFILFLEVGNAGKRQAGIQKPMPDNMGYPCPDTSLWRSKTPPESVHELRPGDIDVVAAIGDSLTSGSAALVDNIYEGLLADNRGVSWSIGGDGTWKTFLTVPNLLKVMNPSLVGYSTGDGSSFGKNSNFNVAYNGAMDQDLMEEAQRLVSRMKKDPRVDFEKHWKMLTIMIGTNDICSDQCYSDDEGTDGHYENLRKFLDYLYENLPRTFINFVSMPYIPYYVDLVNPPLPACFPMKMIMCSCLFGGNNEDAKLSNVANMTRQFQEIQKSLAESNRYEGRDDFAIVYQPTLQDSEFPKLTKPTPTSIARGDNIDYSYVAIDCIHYTQKLHAVTANTLWNNLFEMPGNKTSKWITPAYKNFLCPTSERPYLITRRNLLNDLTKNTL